MFNSSLYNEDTFQLSSTSGGETPSVGSAKLVQVISISGWREGERREEKEGILAAVRRTGEPAKDKPASIWCRGEPLHRRSKIRRGLKDQLHEAVFLNVLAYV